MPVLSGFRNGVLFYDSTEFPNPGGTPTIYVKSIFVTTDGTQDNVIVLNANVLSSSKIIGSIKRPAKTVYQDRGFHYSANVINIVNGQFELQIVKTGWGQDDPSQDTGAANTETIEFNYMIG